MDTVTSERPFGLRKKVKMKWWRWSFCHIVTAYIMCKLCKSCIKLRVRRMWISWFKSQRSNTNCVKIKWYDSFKMHAPNDPCELNFWNLKFDTKLLNKLLINRPDCVVISANRCIHCIQLRRMQCTPFQPMPRRFSLQWHLAILLVIYLFIKPVFN